MFYLITSLFKLVGTSIANPDFPFLEWISHVSISITHQKLCKDIKGVRNPTEEETPTYLDSYLDNPPFSPSIKAHLWNKHPELSRKAWTLQVHYCSRIELSFSSPYIVSELSNTGQRLNLVSIWTSQASTTGNRSARYLRNWELPNICKPSFYISTKENKGHWADTCTVAKVCLCCIFIVNMFKEPNLEE